MTQALTWLLFLFLKKHVPIPMCIVKCKHNCCAVKCCPLILAWASTIHRFQGFEAGPGLHDIVKHLLVDPGPGSFEHLALGILYVALSRAKSIGNFQEIRPPQCAIGFHQFLNRFLHFGGLCGGDHRTGQEPIKD